MEPKWFTLKSYMCPECHTDKDVVRVEEGIDSASHAPYGIITLTCGHKHKLFRVSKELTLKWNTKVSVKPVAKEGVPVAISGGGISPQIASFSELKGFINNNGQFTVENLTLNNTNITYNTSTIYNLNDILIQIDNTN